MNRRRLLIMGGILTVIAVMAIAMASSQRVSKEEMAHLRKDFEKFGGIVAHAQHCGSDLSPTGLELKMLDSIHGLSGKQKESLGQFYDYGYKKKAEELSGQICSFEEREWSLQKLNRTMLSLDQPSGKRTD